GFLYLTIGKPVADFPKGLRHLAGKDDTPQSETRRAALARRLEDLPTRWIGYNHVDLALLTTADPAILAGLLRDGQRRRALVDWVRRGGRLAISYVPDSPGAKLVQDFLGSWNPPPFLPSDSYPTVQFAELEQKDTWIKEQIPYGLGRLTLLAFDVQEQNFAAWKGPGPFWKAFIEKLGPRAINPAGPHRRGAAATDSTDLATRLARELDQFSVPVFSFGWVALFMLLYILVIGPLDYWFLKKVVKRLEWTW